MLKANAITFLLFYFFTFSALTNEWNIHLPDGRPSAPYPNINNYNEDLSESGVGLGYTVPVSRHHIIPYNIIRDFYNAVIRNQRRQIIIGGFFRNVGVLIGRYAGHHGVLCNDAVMSSLESASELSYMIAAGQISNSDQVTLRPNGFDELTEYYAWLPGNLFVGPTSRADDPGEDFEQNSLHLIGHERFIILRDLYNQMRVYISLAERPEAETLPYLRRIAVLLTQVARITHIRRLSSSEWRRRADGKYEIITDDNGDANIDDVNNPSWLAPADADPLSLRCFDIKPQHKLIITEKGRGYDEI
ncbi:hypothetical protein [Aeromonas salmonicida]|uniref:hypothetical protein n=1 Tax=Aeromonas salmonicida TaxID=645 RepID=UPI003D260FDC